jgi:hypothetical protein
VLIEAATASVQIDREQQHSCTCSNTATVQIVQRLRQRATVQIVREQQQIVQRAAAAADRQQIMQIVCILLDNSSTL